MFHGEGSPHSEDTRRQLIFGGKVKCLDKSALFDPSGHPVPFLCHFSCVLCHLICRAHVSFANSPFPVAITVANLGANGNDHLPIDISYASE